MEMRREHWSVRGLQTKEWEDLKYFIHLTKKLEISKLPLKVLFCFVFCLQLNVGFVFLCSVPVAWEWPQSNLVLWVTILRVVEKSLESYSSL